jgi:hypothetical protein
MADKLEVGKNETEEMDGGREIGPANGGVMEGFKEKRSVAEICGEHKISQTLYY